MYIIETEVSLSALLCCYCLLSSSLQQQFQPNPIVNCELELWTELIINFVSVLSFDVNVACKINVTMKKNISYERQKPSNCLSLINVVR